MDTTGNIPRPEYGVINPEITRLANRRLYFFLITLGYLLVIAYTVYVSSNISSITLTTDGVSLVLNLIIFFIEIMLGYYSLLLYFHLTRGFLPVSHPLVNRITGDTPDNELPLVTIMLPMYEEPLQVISQTIGAALDLNYPSDRYEVLVVDDSKKNDKLRELCDKLGLGYITRDNRSGFKAGGINHALPSAKGEYILFLDADHIPERNIIRNCLLAWREDTIAVQTRIDFVNMFTYLTTIAAFLQIQFFSLFQRARRASGSAIFAGGATLFDAELLRKFGGFDPLTIADDTDNSFIFRAAGYRIEYIDVIGAWALVPWDPLHLIRQIWRWLTGITRSFRARWMVIIRGKSSVYIKLDHLSVGFFPTLSIFGWGVAFIIGYMVINDISIVRTPLLAIPLFALIPLFVSTLAIITGILAVLLDDKRAMFHRKGVLEKTGVILGFYLLVLAAQPLLLGAIFKGLTGIKVKFNRTPKEKNTSDDLTAVKRRYAIYTLFIFVVGIVFLLIALSIPLSDPRAITLLISAYASILPIIISGMWYWKLEGYIEKVADITAVDVLGNVSI